MTETTSNRLNVATPVLLLAIFGLVLAAATRNPLYLMCCLVTFYGLIYILWRKFRPGILVFAFLMQWTQVITYVLWMDDLGMDIDRLSPHAGIAILMACLGLLAMAATLSYRLKDLPTPSLDQLIAQAKLIDEKKILILYLVSTFFLGGLGFAFGNNPGLFQILTTISTLKWVFFLVYGYVAWINKKNRLTLMLIILFEFGTGLYSYFSTFKTVIFFTIILAFTFIRHVSFKQVIIGLLAATVLFFLLLTWTAIKSDYRNYLNQGSKQQVVEVSRSDAFNKIGEKVAALKWQDFQNVLFLFLFRAQYIYHLAKTMDRVPSVLPHEYGRVWWDNVSFVLMPRLLFPNKPRYEATIKTNKYTGIHYAGFKSGASFSLGYFADSYIDFDYYGMLLPLVMIALFVSFIYRTFYSFQKLNILMRFAVINVALLDFTSFESDGLFLFGRLLLLFLVYWVLGKYVLSRLQVWLYKPSKNKTRI